jgi:hypothetical protein
MAGMRSGLVILTALLLSGSVTVAQQAGKPCVSDIKTLCAGIQPGEGRILHKIAFDRPVANLRGPRAHDGGDRKGVQDGCYEPVCRYCARHRRYQSLHKIAYGRGE